MNNSKTDSEPKPKTYNPLVPSKRKSISVDLDEYQCVQPEGAQGEKNEDFLIAHDDDAEMGAALPSEKPLAPEQCRHDRWKDQCVQCSEKKPTRVTCGQCGKELLFADELTLCRSCIANFSKPRCEKTGSVVRSAEWCEENECPCAPCQNAKPQCSEKPSIDVAKEAREWLPRTRYWDRSGRGYIQRDSNNLESLTDTLVAFYQYITEERSRS